MYINSWWASACAILVSNVVVCCPVHLSGEVAILWRNWCVQTSRMAGVFLDLWRSELPYPCFYFALPFNAVYIYLWRSQPVILTLSEYPKFWGQALMIIFCRLSCCSLSRTSPCGSLALLWCHLFHRHGTSLSLLQCLWHIYRYRGSFLCKCLFRSPFLHGSISWFCLNKTTRATSNGKYVFNGLQHSLVPRPASGPRPARAPHHPGSTMNHEAVSSGCLWPGLWLEHSREPFANI